MQGTGRRWWPVVKALGCLAILAFVGRRFAHDLSRLDLDRPISVGPLVLAAVLYLCGLGLAGLYWRWLLGQVGHPAPLFPALRAYFLSQLGKYVPGKALSIVMRAWMARSFGVPAGIAGLTAFYEVFVTLASGALLSFVLWLALAPIEVPSFADLVKAWRPLLSSEAPAILSPSTVAPVALLLSLLLVVPALPPVYNRILRRSSTQTVERPPLRSSHLVAGLLLLAGAWLLMAASLMAVLESVPGASLSRGLPGLAKAAACLGVAYAAGFVVLVAPGGLGVRELLLVVLLAPDVGEDRAALAALLLRLVWTGGELLLALALWPLPVRSPSPSSTVVVV